MSNSPIADLFESKKLISVEVVPTTTDLLVIVTVATPDALPPKIVAMLTKILSPSKNPIPLSVGSIVTALALVAVTFTTPFAAVVLLKFTSPEVPVAFALKVTLVPAVFTLVTVVPEGILAPVTAAPTLIRVFPVERLTVG